MSPWPDPQRPGEPADPARPWHWLGRLEDGGMAPLPVGWNGGGRHWVLWDGSQVEPREAARRFRYLGPAQTPAEVKAAVADAVADATPPAPPPEPTPPSEMRGLAGMAANPAPEPLPAMVFRKDAIRVHLLVFAGTLFGTLFIADKFNVFR